MFYMKKIPSIKLHYSIWTMVCVNIMILGLHGGAELGDAGAILALRALGWGTLYAVAGTGFLCYGIWKLSGAKDVSSPIQLMFHDQNAIHLSYCIISVKGF